MNRSALVCTAATLTVLAAATACKTTTASHTTSKTTAPASTGTSDSKTSTATKAVHNFVGMGLQSAQDAAQKQGFHSLTSHDSTGRARMQILDRDWKVCSQNIKPGTNTATTTKLDFGAVKLAETCPAKDQSAPSAAGGTMPDFRGESVKAARAALDSGTSITVNDASSDGRMVLIESNWQVCTQKPAAGTKLAGQPVEFTAVKYGEHCP
ncbi:PASTA domain-containing protein [Streptomyces sp. NRRL B-3648]|uniref:PASTA domain-containing protein n=1 Tax=Streptomyces sp. NRRL B-3648 TaxID=1519493 RepID=UPI000ABF90B0|nr:hypothetical protein [Streptomyces sp. NRRL B-3648]